LRKTLFTLPSLPRFAAIMVLTQGFLLIFIIAGTYGVFQRLDKPTTTDFVSFYAAGDLANRGRAADAYDRAAHLKAEEAATAPGIDYQFYFNPPTFTLLMAPLARLPYLVSFYLFEAATFALWLWLGSKVAGGGRTAALCLAAVPSVYWVLGLGQNGFLTASLMAGGLLLLPDAPFAAGLVFGMQCFKPHYGLLLPVVLLAARQWRAMLGAALSVCAMVGVSLAWFGIATWRAFFAMALGSNRAISGNEVLIAAHIEPRGALWQMGAPLGLSQQAGSVLALMIAVIITVPLFRMWRERADAPAFAALAAGAILVAPFALFYDLILASLSAAWLVRDARARGLLPGERLCFGAAFALNLVHYWLAVVGKLPVSPGSLIAPLFLLLAWRRRRVLGPA
jgi:hypothetical protein